MFRINNNDFKILQKYKIFLINLNNSLENIPRKDMYFKDRIRNISLDVLKDILLCFYDTSSVSLYRTSIKANITLLDFMLERLLLKKYVSEKNLYKLATDLVEINKMVTGWLNINVKINRKYKILKNIKWSILLI